MVSTATQISHFSFDNCLMNAAGVYCMTKEELMEVEKSQAASFVTKTGTLKVRPGNPEPRYADTRLGSINSMGLPNNGFRYYLDFVSDLAKTGQHKPHFLSVVGLSPTETETILKAIMASDYEGLVELNLSCPNVPGKPQIAYDFETTDQLLENIFTYYTKPLGIKLPPYFDIVHFDQAAAIFNKYPLSFVNCVNSIGNGLVIEDEQVLIKPKNGF
ncbi:TPA: dihydroorotate oxidase, partial [Streptococcus pyogenes]